MQKSEEKKEVVYLCPHCFEVMREYFAADEDKMPTNITCPNCAQEFELKPNQKTVGTYASKSKW